MTELSSGFTAPPLRGTVLMFLSCLQGLDEADENILRPLFMELACDSMNADSLVVRHAALHLFWRNICHDFTIACELMTLVVDLLQRAWDPIWSLYLRLSSLFLRRRLLSPHTTSSNIYGPLGGRLRARRQRRS
jgi:hypothetical protein